MVWSNECLPGNQERYFVGFGMCFSTSLLRVKRNNELIIVEKYHNRHNRIKTRIVSRFLVESPIIFAKPSSDQARSKTNQRKYQGRSKGIELLCSSARQRNTYYYLVSLAEKQ